jgi:hypothetical protein
MFYFVQLPWGPWTIARRDDRGRWWLTDGNNNPVDREYFQEIGDRIPVPDDGNHLSISW